MLAALTGTPGTGKSSVASFLEGKGVRLCSLDDLATSTGARTAWDPVRDSWAVDLERLQEGLPPTRPLLLVGHLAHLFPVDLAIVLRCHPEVLRGRLQKRGWADAKVRENVEAEALGTITAETPDGVETYEADTTSTPPEATAQVILKILQGRGEEYLGRWVDWSEVILEWY